MQSVVASRIGVNAVRIFNLGKHDLCAAGRSRTLAYAATAGCSVALGKQPVSAGTKNTESATRQPLNTVHP
jgi:hypothetical protein